MAKRKPINKFRLFTILGGLVVFFVVAFTLLSFTATTKAVVLNADGKAGTTITESMLDEIDVPQSTPGNFYKTKNSLIGERLTSNVKQGQLIYSSDLMSSIDVASNSNENFVTTCVRIPDDNALGGLLTAGDVVDISVVPQDGKALALSKALPDFHIDPSLNGGVYFILSNVKILDATTAVSNAQGSNLSTVTKQTADGAANASGSAKAGDKSGASYYMISLSYNDYKKLRLAEQFGSLYMSLVPSQNKDKSPLIAEMALPVADGLTDASQDMMKDDRENIQKQYDEEVKAMKEAKKAGSTPLALKSTPQGQIPADTKPAEPNKK